MKALGPQHYLDNLKSGQNNLPRLLLTLLLVSLALYVGSIPLRTDSYDTYFQSYNIVYFIALLFPFILGIIVLMVSFHFLHGLPVKQLVIPAGSGKPDIKRIVFSFTVWAVILILVELIGYYIDPGNYRFQAPDRQFIGLVVVALVLLPIQTSFEELFIRSYVTQQFNYYTRNILLSVLSAAVIFAFMHSENPETSSFGFGLMFIYYFIAGLFLGLIAYKDGRLELSLGVHAANNIFGAIIVNYEGSVFKTSALFTTVKINMVLSLVSFCIASVVFYIICYYRYNWKCKETNVEIIN